ncbi:MAG: YraN family protein [Armatimonadota bacterium]|nr:YraN family protein [Armatimonadota bacterium]MDR7439878.1 YraN family protein [Armatimonadota bacterium]MDR7563327.1 YraN family protein [Armatimonadota bacterium]MDR7567481.1 YraN family protein [Armatimonadota bacterium]MDR7601970.1 YraN family protein [Armatimonadota bacterium]
MDRRRIGSGAEEVAADLLRRTGYRILDRNVRFRFGELDLVCEREGIVVFVEVKARFGDARGHPLEAVTLHKQRRLARLALAYLQRKGLGDRPCRFDVVAVHLGPQGRPVRAEVLQDAFRL